MDQAFSTNFETNGTHFKCWSNEEWAQQWFKLDYGLSAACSTSNFPVAYIYWR